MSTTTESELSHLYKNIIENNWNAIVFADMQGTVQFVNSAANKLYGYSGDELVGENVDIFNSRETHNTDDIVRDLTENGHWLGELVQKKKDGSTFNALLQVQVINNSEGVPIGLASNSKDISKDNETKVKLKQTIQEKEVLIKEIHHRVKNNLSIVQGMLRLQRSSTKDISLDEFLMDFESRISILSEAHNNLNSSYSSDKLIQLDEYLLKIYKGIEALYAGMQSQVSFVHDLKPINVQLDYAIPIALIMNEIVTNSYKHAFHPNGGTLSVTLEEVENGFMLNIGDDGPGFDTKDSVNNNRLGLSLIDGLVEQVDGEIKLKSGSSGTNYSLKIITA